MRRLILLMAIVIPAVCKAQTDDALIQKTIGNFFTAMRTADTVLLKTTLSPNAALHTIGRNKEMQPTVKVEAIQDFIDFVGSSNKEADERIGTMSMFKDASLASVWMYYEFYYKGKFSHCGHNSFQLVKLGGSWKIQFIIDTRTKDNCKEQQKKS